MTNVKIIPNDQILLKAAKHTKLEWLLNTVDACRIAYDTSLDFRNICDKIEKSGQLKD